MTVIRTARLQLSPLDYEDCEFVRELVNEPDFKRYIGDKQVETLEDARSYLRNGPIGSFEKHGFGMFLVSLLHGGEPLGMCGLLKREQFSAPDIGFAFLRRFWAQGYALESARAVMTFGIEQLKLARIIAIVDPDNIASVRLIEKLGLEFERKVRMEGDSSDIDLYSAELN